MGLYLFPTDALLLGECLGEFRRLRELYEANGGQNKSFLDLSAAASYRFTLHSFHILGTEAWPRPKTRHESLWWT